MSHTIKKIPTPAGWSEATTIRSALLAKKPLAPIPAGWETIHTLAKKERISTTSLRRMIPDAITAGLLEKKNWPQPDSNGRVLNYPIYRRLK